MECFLETCADKRPRASQNFTLGYTPDALLAAAISNSDLFVCDFTHPGKIVEGFAVRTAPTYGPTLVHMAAARLEMSGVLALQ